MNKILFASMSLFLAQANAFATCSQAAATDDPNFCPSFKSVATCHCTESGLPAFLCQDMGALYNRMLLVFGTVQKACEFQKDTDTQTCLDDWSCYREGGKDSLGRECSSTSKPCQ